MFSKNVGTFDRIARIIVGLLLVALYFIYPGGTYSWLYLVIGAVPLVTGLIGTCPLYSLLGMNTCGVTKK